MQDSRLQKKRSSLGPLVGLAALAFVISPASVDAQAMDTYGMNARSQALAGAVTVADVPITASCFCRGATLAR